MKMEVRRIQSVQRVANFTLDDGKMLEVEHNEALIPGVTMVCDLPLLFRNGFPTCLENLTVGQLEKFVPYMIRCSGVSPRMKPKWWPDEVYSTELSKSSNMTDKDWLSYLKRLVSRCYSYHGCEYALKLCADLSHKCRSKKRVSECELEKSTSQSYKVPRGMPITRRSTKLGCGVGLYHSSRGMKIPPKRNTDNEHEQNKWPEQIYLCDNCDSEFRTSKEIYAHEKLCTEENIFKASFLPENVRKNNPNRYTLRNNNERNTHNATSSATRSGSAVLSKNQTIKIPQYVDSSSVATNSLTKMQSKSREPCKSCGLLFVSSKLLSDHESICLKQQVLLARFLSASSKTIASCKVDRREQLSSQHKISGTNTNSTSPLRKKRMKLLPRRTCQINNNRLTQNDIFLCDNCDKEFTSLTDIQSHEASGCKVTRELTPSPVPNWAHELSAEENFLRFFELSPTSKSLTTFRPISGSASRSKRFLGNPMRYSAIPVSSPLGSLIHGSQVPTSAILTKIEKVERYCLAKPTSTFHLQEANNADPEWRVSWKERKDVIHETAHSYIYPLKRWWRMPEIWNTQIKIEERNRFLRNTCKSVEIRLRKLTNREIQLYSVCRTVRPIVKKMTREEIRLYCNL